MLVSSEMTDFGYLCMKIHNTIIAWVTVFLDNLIPSQKMIYKRGN